ILLARLEQATQTSIENLDSVLVGAEVNVEDILNLTRRDFTGRGGTYAPLEQDFGGRTPPARTDAFEPANEVRIASLVNGLERVNLMRIAIDRLPFGMPTEGARITSRFGTRSDPYRHSKAM